MVGDGTPAHRRKASPSPWPPAAFTVLTLIALAYLLLTPPGITTVGQDALLSDFYQALETQPGLEAVYYTGDDTLVWTSDGDVYSTTVPSSTLDVESHEEIALSEGDAVDPIGLLWIHLGSFVALLVGLAPIAAIVDVIVRSKTKQPRTDAGLWVLALIALPAIGVIVYLMKMPRLTRAALLTSVVLVIGAALVTAGLVGTHRVDTHQRITPTAAPTYDAVPQVET
jgi:hypothetical protein